MMFKKKKIYSLLHHSVQQLLRARVKLYHYFDFLSASSLTKATLTHPALRASSCLLVAGAAFVLAADTKEIFPCEKDSAHYSNIDTRYCTNKCINIFFLDKWRQSGSEESAARLKGICPRQLNQCGLFFFSFSSSRPFPPKRRSFFSLWISAVLQLHT